MLKVTYQESQSHIMIGLQTLFTTVQPDWLSCFGEWWLNPISYFYFYPLFLNALCPLKNRVTRCSCWNCPLWNGTTLQESITSPIVADDIYVNRLFRSFTICCLYLWWFMFCYCGNPGITTMPFAIWDKSTNARILVTTSRYQSSHQIKKNTVPLLH